MTYKYGWIYAFLLLLGAFYMDIVPHYLELKSLKQSHTDLLLKWQTLEKLEKPKQPNATIKVNSDHPLNALVGIMRAKNLMVESAEMNPVKPTDQDGVLLAHFTAEGSLASLAAVIAELPKQPFLSAVSHFSFKRMSQANLNISLDLLVFKGYQRLFSSIANPSIPTNPFCLDENLFMPSFKNGSLKSPNRPLSNLKMVGYLHQGHHTMGIVSASNNMTMDVSIGSLLGEEKAVVTAILPDRIVLVLPDKKRYDLIMKEAIK